MENGESKSAASTDEPTFPQANLAAIQSIRDVLAGSYGPCGRDKLIVAQLADEEATVPGEPGVDDYVVTSDGATILEYLPFEHPVSPLVERMAGPERPGETAVEGADVTDGVTTTTTFAGALADEATTLIERGVHPRTVQQGYYAAHRIATSAMEDIAIDPDPVSVARSALTGNVPGGHVDDWAEMSSRVAEQIGRPTAETFAIRTFNTGSIDDSHLVWGAALDRNEIVHPQMSRHVEDASVLLLVGSDGTGLQTRSTETEITLDITSPRDIEAFEARANAERETVIEDLLKIGPDVIVAQQGIDKYYQRRLAAEGVLAVRGVTSDDLTQVTRATGAKPIVDPRDAASTDLGEAGVVTERRTDPRDNRRNTRRMVVFDECVDPGSLTAVVHGVRGPLAQQVTTGLRKAVNAAAGAMNEKNKWTGALPGAGAAEISAAVEVRDAARSEQSRRQLAMEAYADALETIPRTLANTVGRDPDEMLAALREANATGGHAGILLPDGQVSDPVAAGVLDPLDTRVGALRTATSVVALLLCVDDAIDATFDQTSTDSGDAIYDEPVERHEEYLDKNDDTIWG